MHTRLFPFLILALIFTADDSRAQLSVPGLAAGISTRAEVGQLLGPPVREVSATLSEYKSPAGSNKIYVQYGAAGDKAERIEFVLAQKEDRIKITSALGLGEPSKSKVNSRSRLEEYFSGGNIVLTHEGSDSTSPVSRLAYYSPRLFASAAGLGEGDQQAARPSVVTERVTPPAPPLGPRKDDNQIQVTVERDSGGMELTDEDKKNLIKALNLPEGANFVTTGKPGEFRLPDSGE